LRFEGKIRQTTISQDTDDKYYVSILVETEHIVEPKAEKAVGLDWGRGANILVTSDGEKIKNPKFGKNETQKIKKLSRELSRRTKDGKNWNKTRVKLARKHAHIQNQRKGFLHKLTTRLVDENQVLVVENLCVKDIVATNNEAEYRQRRHKANKATYDATPYMLQEMLRYKAEWNDRNFQKVDASYTSQDCSVCGYREKHNLNSARNFVCNNCGVKLHRDINAAINILNRRNGGVSLLNKDALASCSQEASRDAVRRRFGLNDVC
jgi:putative transposase